MLGTFKQLLIAIHLHTPSKTAAGPAGRTHPVAFCGSRPDGRSYRHRLHGIRTV
ncbi:hypothetical protein LHK_00019 [Laribacter hongkongensis HLHK9]|uniref:Uncharacterized protein n=1 Tax=Laribacter hongkongensis (strain HLHK9) TaxID=557598 RepID=C1D9B5_LARHH|nr:hypothetical protein LHK_00019 [Laribacter hongkongensis HLHK9]